jgi:hypothetical protein
MDTRALKNSLTPAETKYPISNRQKIKNDLKFNIPYRVEHKSVHSIWRWPIKAARLELANYLEFA